MMELNRTTDGFREAKTSARAFLSIDLNEIPSAVSCPPAVSPRDALAVVLSFHERLASVSGGPAYLPRGAASATCAACRIPEQSGPAVVCDGCERGFHLRCVGMAEKEAASFEDWICEECSRNGTRSQRWQLGASNTSASVHQNRPEVRLFDINALPSSDGEAESCEVPQQDSKSNVKAAFAKAEANGGMEPSCLHNILPIQFEDFCILSLGKVDVRPSYHDACNIWPIGYRSCWHDKITGSVFSCDVLDGGDEGPVFRVSRSSCSSLLVPSGSTVIFEGSLRWNDRKHVNEFDHCTSASLTSGEDDAIQMILLGFCPPTEMDVLSCLDGCLNRHHQTSSHLQPEPGACGEEIFHSFSNNTQLVKDVGEFSFEGRSISAAWKMASQKLIDDWCKTFKNNHTLKSACEHLNKELSHTQSNDPEDMQPCGFSTLAKLCGSPRCASTFSRLIHVDCTLEAFREALHSWIDEDRFGLDVLFVQEIIEQLPDVNVCSKYTFLNERMDYSKSVTIKNKSLFFEMKGDIQGDRGPFSELFTACNPVTPAVEASSDDPRPPLPGRSLSSNLPRELFGDVLQIWELVGQFHEILGFKEPFSFEVLEKELVSPGLNVPKPSQAFEVRHDYSSQIDDAGEEACKSGGKLDPSNSGCDRCILVTMRDGEVSDATDTGITQYTPTTLAKVHGAFLEVLVGELQSRVTSLVNQTSDAGEVRSRRGKKKDVDMSRTKLCLLPINGLTWQEIARRYILAFLCMDGNCDSAEITARESMKVFRCLCGDGGVLCGSLTGVVGLEADVLLLAEAEKQIFSSLNRDGYVFVVEDSECGENGSSDGPVINESSMPDWATLLEPVRKLPTNVGTRIRKCVYEALDKAPPEWAKKILEHSISKEVYKGNASGPTKKAVVSVLAKVQEDIKHQSIIERKKTVVVIPDLVMRQCRIVLRRAASADDAKVLYNLLGMKLTNYNENDDEGILGYPAMVSRPLDFRTIDLRLAAGVYNGSHEAFHEDVRELWFNIRAAFVDKHDILELADTLSQNFELLYQEEVVTLFQKLVWYSKSNFLSPEAKKEIYDTIASVSEIPKAPWDEGVCKVCGVDKDDDSVLLCDTCDAEYHTYCLKPPLIRIPEGNWYCPSCTGDTRPRPDSSVYTDLFDQCNAKKHLWDSMHLHLSDLTNLSTSLEEKEYCELGIEERTFLLKFLSDELLNSTLIRQHLEHCSEMSAEIQQKLRSFALEWKNLKLREQILVAKAAKLERNTLCNVVEVKTGEGSVNNGSYLENHDGISMLLSESGKKQADSNGISLGRGDMFESQLVTSTDAETQKVGDLAAVANCNHSSSPADAVLQTSNQSHANLPSTPNVNGPNISVEVVLPQNGVAESETHHEELKSIKNNLSVLKDSVLITEAQLLKLSGRRELLGRDSAGRLYWILPKPGNYPWLVVDGSVAQQAEKQKKTQKNVPITCHSNWAVFRSDDEIKELIQWLRDEDPNERELKESIIHLKKFKVEGHEQFILPDKAETCNAFSKFGNEKFSRTSNNLATVASTILERQHGHFQKLCTDKITRRQGTKRKADDKDQLCRCECLEPIWPSRPHCISCHKTFLNDTDLEQHETDKCISYTVFEDTTGNDGMRKQGDTNRSECKGDHDVVKAQMNDFPKLNSTMISIENEGCPFNFEQICSRFVTQDSNKELVREIGLIGSNNVPSFVPFVPPYVSESSLMLIHSEEFSNANESDVSKAAMQESFFEWQNDNLTNNPLKLCDVDEPSMEKHLISDKNDAKTSSSWHLSETAASLRCVVPQYSLRPLVGKSCVVLRALKINLLDMDAALPEVAFRQSKSSLEERCAWREFVKSSRTIFQMVQATIVLENMMKAEHLRNWWWYWSSLSAAARISTMSALALRIYSLDAAIIYDKGSLSSGWQVSSTKVGECSELSIVDTAAEKRKLDRRSSKRRKESNG